MKRKLFLLYFCKIKIRKTKASNLSTFDFAYFADELQTNRAKQTASLDRNAKRNYSERVVDEATVFCVSL